MFLAPTTIRQTRPTDRTEASARATGPETAAGPRFDGVPRYNGCPVTLEPPCVEDDWGCEPVHPVRVRCEGYGCRFDCQCDGRAE